MTLIPSTLGKRIAHLRDRRGWKQRELAGRARLSTTFISEVENDKRNVSSEVLLRIANALGASLDYLMKGTAESSSQGKSLEIPPRLAEAAENQEWSYSDTATLLETRQFIQARRSHKATQEKQIRDLTSEEWIDFHKRIFNE